VARNKPTRGALAAREREQQAQELTTSPDSFTQVTLDVEDTSTQKRGRLSRMTPRNQLSEDWVLLGIVWPCLTFVLWLVFLGINRIIA